MSESSASPAPYRQRRTESSRQRRGRNFAHGSSDPHVASAGSERMEGGTSVPLFPHPRAMGRTKPCVSSMCLLGVSLWNLMNQVGVMRTNTLRVYPSPTKLHLYRIFCACLARALRSIRVLPSDAIDVVPFHRARSGAGRRGTLDHCKWLLSYGEQRKTSGPSSAYLGK